MKTSEHTADLLAALLKAKASFAPIIRSQHVKVTTKSGRSYDFDYAPLEVIQSATDTALSAEGLALISAVQPGPDGTVEVVTRLLHTSEQWLESCIPSGALEDVKALGGFVSYARRYNTLALLDLSAEDDLDGSQATGDHIEPRAKVTAPSTNGHHAQPHGGESPERPTEAHISALTVLALQDCAEDPEAFRNRLRHVMHIPLNASVAPKLLTRTMSMTQYMEVMQFYQRLLSQLQRKTPEVSNGSVAAQKTPPEPTPAPPEEGPAAVPQPGHSAEESLSAPEHGPDAAAERDRQRLRQEVAQWTLRISEQEHVIRHNPYSKARGLLWQCRIEAPAAPLTAAAAN